MITPLSGTSAISYTPPVDPVAKPQGAFLDTLKGAMDQVEQIHADASSQVSDLVTGKGGDIHGAMIAVEKADLSFQMMMQVRNKIVAAYQEVSRMPF